MSPGLGVGFSIANADGVGVFQFGARDRRERLAPRQAAGERIEVEAGSRTCSRPAATSSTAGSTGPHGAGVALYVHNALDFVVFGGDAHSRGIVSPPSEIDGDRERG